MGEGIPKLTLVSSQKKPRRVYAGHPLECKCGSRTTIEVQTGRTIKNGKVSAGVKQIRCYHCQTVIWG